MKKLIASLAVSLGLVLVNISSAVAAETWRLNMYDPAATTERTINIAYQVFSTTSTDTFKVELFQDVTEVAEQNVTHPNGDSGKFTVNLPASGTYTYKIVATNNTDMTTQDESRTVQVVDGPTPTVTTVFVNNGAAGGQGAGGAQTAGAGAGGANAAGGAGAGEVAGAAANEGQVSAEGSATDENNEESGDVLGESETTANNNRRNITLGIALVLVAAGAAYYWFLARPRNSA